MTSLTNEARELIDCAKEAESVDEEQVARLRHSILQKAGVVAGAGAIATGSAIAASKATASTATASTVAKTSLFVFAAKTLSAALVVGVAASAGYSSYSHFARKAPSDLAPAKHVVRAATPARAHPAQALTAPEPSPEPLPTRAALPSANVSDLPVATAKRLAPMNNPPPSDLADLARLRDAHLALARGDAESALRSVEAARASGPLAEERDGIRALALCKLQREEAFAEAAAFEKRWPDSPLVANVRACALTLKER